jgi:hypothetical protein
MTKKQKYMGAAGILVLVGLWANAKEETAVRFQPPAGSASVAGQPMPNEATGFAMPPQFAPPEMPQTPQMPQMASMPMDPNAPPMDMSGLIGSVAALGPLGDQMAREAAVAYYNGVQDYRRQTGDYTTQFNVNLPQNHPNTSLGGIIGSGEYRNRSGDYVSQRRSDAMRGTETQDPYRYYPPRYPR